jgi:site-specific recombinase XerD
MERRTFSIMFFIRRTKLRKNLEAPILLRITVNGERTDVSVQRSIRPEQWNSAKGCARTITQYGKDLNLYLDQVRLLVYQYHQDLISRDMPVTAAALKSAYMHNVVEEHHTLLELYLEHNTNLKSRIDKGISKNTCIRHETSRRHLERFIKDVYMQDDISLKSIDHVFVRKYETYLRTTRNCNNNSTVKYLKNFGKVVREAMNRDWILSNPFRNIKFQLEEVDKPFLNQAELQKIMGKDFQIIRIAQVRDVFVFCCFTGLAFIDVKTLTPKDIETGVDGNLWIRKQRNKSRQWAHIPLLPVACQLIERYKDNSDCQRKGVLLPVLSNQKMNAYLKEIADLCGIQKNLTTHCARHTFATTVTLANKISMESVSKMLGHSSLNMTRRYARILDSTIGQEMSQLAEKLKDQMN